MINRGVQIAGFLVQHKWDDAQQIALDADFSPRRYARLIKSDGSRAILMDADPDQKTTQFIEVAKLLKQLDVSVPTVMAEDRRSGLVLLEDFGDINIGRSLDAGQQARPYLRRAVDVLVHVHRQFRPEMVQSFDMPIFDGARFADQASLFLDVYFPVQANRPASDQERQSFLAAWQEVLSVLSCLPASLLLRDYMPDNLMHLEGREAWRSIGVLDFQDAGVGSVAYDLASLAEVVRRDGQDGLLDDLLGYYHQEIQPVYNLKDLKVAAMVLSAQRHTRILGIIVRLAQKGRSEKLAYLPRIRQHLKQQFQHPALKPVADWFNLHSPLNT